MTPASSHEALQATLFRLEQLAQELPTQIAGDRIHELEAIAKWIVDANSKESIDLIFICTHNSRRSHMGQILAQAAAWHFGLKNVRTYSGGTEATAFDLRAIQALKDLGVSITESSPGNNPVYQVSLQSGESPFSTFSKSYQHASNPQQGFAAIMTCNHANESCPVVLGAAARFSTPYVDPKISDGTKAETKTYAERAMQIGTEMFYVMAIAHAKITGE